MKKRFFVFISVFVVCSHSFGTEPKIAFWSEQKKGTNFFNKTERIERFQAAKNFGVQIARIAPNKWLNGRPEAELGNFLIGPKEGFKQINEADLKYLQSVLDQADKVGLKVVLTMLSLPGNRWAQHNGRVEERRLWQDFAQQDHAISFWKQLAGSLKDHPAVVGYNIRNEPSPEHVEPRLGDWFTKDYSAWYKKVKGTPADLNLFYRKAVKAIREVDQETPIVLDTGFFATAWGFKVLEPVQDDKIIYSFHMYEPYAFNSQFNKGKYKYPGPAPLGDSDHPPILSWNKQELEKYLAPVSEWQVRYRIPSSRIFVGEFGVFRTNPGAAEYLRDLLQIIQSKKWHWAFYSFREDEWAGMDYELGITKPPWKYWESIEKGEMPDPKVVYKPNPLWEVLKNALKN